MVRKREVWVEKGQERKSLEGEHEVERARK